MSFDGSEKYEMLRKRVCSINLEKLKPQKKVPPNFEELSRTYCEFRNSIIVLTNTLYETKQSERDIKVVNNLVEHFEQFLEHTVTISWWTEGQQTVHDNAQIRTLHSHFCKFVFPKDVQAQIISQDKEFFVSILQGICNHYKKQMDGFMISIHSFHAELSDFLSEINALTYNEMLRTGDCYLVCLESLKNQIKILKDFITDSVGRCHNYHTLMQSLRMYNVNLMSTTDHVMQVVFLSSCMMLSSENYEELFQRGKVIQTILHIERMLLMNIHDQEIMDKIDALKHHWKPFLGQDVSTKLEQLKCSIPKDKPYIKQELRQMRMYFCHAVSQQLPFSQIPSTYEAIEIYKKECIDFIQRGKRLIDVFVSVPHMQAENTKTLQVSAFLGSCDNILDGSRMLFKKLKWLNLLLISRKQYSTNKQDICIQRSLAMSCKKKQLLVQLEALMVKKPDLENLTSYSNHFDNLAVVTIPVCELFKCLKSTQELRKKFDELLHQYYSLIVSDDLKCTDEKEGSFQRKVLEFKVYFTSLLDAFLSENKPKYFKDLQISVDNSITSSESVTVTLQFLCDSEYLGNYSIGDVGVEVYSKSSGSQSFQNVVVIRRREGFSVAQSEFKIPKNSCRTLFYRYMISHEPEMLSVNGNRLEDVENCYRVLNIPSNQGEVSAFDSFVYRRTPPQRGFMKEIYRRLTGSIEFEVPDRKHCLLTTLNCYLEGSLNRLSECSNITQDEIKSICTNVSGVINYFENTKVIDVMTKKDGILLYQESPNKETLKLLKSTLDVLKASISSHRVISALVLNRFMLEIPHSTQSKKEMQVDLIRMFHPTFIDGNECLEYNIILRTLPDSRYRKPFINCLGKLLSKNCEAGGKMMIELWNLLCFIHWFECDPSQKPFSKLQMNDDFKTYHLRSRKHLPSLNPLKIGDIQQALKNFHFQQLLKADPLLQFLLFQLCPESKYNLIAESVQSPILISCTCISIKEKIHSEQKLQNLNSLMGYLFDHRDPFLSKYIDMNGEILLNLFDWLTKHIHDDDKKKLPQSDAFKKFVFTALKVFMYCCNSEKAPMVSFINTFACERFGRNFDMVHMKKEEKFWSELCSLDTTNDMWRETLTKLIKTRLDKNMSDNMMVLFIELESNNESIVFFTLKKLLGDKLKDIITSQRDFLKNRRYFENSSSLKFMLCQQIDVMFSESNLSCLDLVSYDFWPVAMNTIVNQCDGVSSHSVNLADAVKKLLGEIFLWHLKNGEFTISQLSLIKKTWESHLIPLFEIFQLGSDGCYKALQKSWENTCVFELFIVTFDFFLSSNNNTFESLSNVSKRFFTLKQEYHQHEIKLLCTDLDDDSYSFPCLCEADLFIPLLIPYVVVNSKDFINDIFVCKWHNALIPNKGIEIEKILSQIWTPVFTECTQLLHKLEHEEITISEAADIFGVKEKSEIEQSIKRLLMGTKTCEHLLELGWKKIAMQLNNQNVEVQVDTISKSFALENPPNWISNITNKISEWCCVQSLSQIADTLMQIVEDLSSSSVEIDCLQLFTSQQVTYMECTKLRDLTQEMVFAKRQLERIKCITSDVWNTVKQFCKEQELTDWIREKSKNLHEMEKFISVAMGTIAGEGHEIQDRLSDLQILCGKFSPLLYHLSGSKPCALEHFLTCISEASKKIDNCTVDINQILVVCSSHLQWYVSQGELQGSVEKGAVKELDDINNFGKYTVEISKKTGLYEVSLVVLAQTETVQKHYCLNDLQELESKLVLITRQRSEWAESKKGFQSMLQQVVRITDVAQKLKDYGHTQYLDWSTGISCSQYCAEEDFRELVELTCVLENELSYLINYVWYCRQKFYHLNLYTNQQLMILRKELTALQENTAADADSQLFHLLHSIIGHLPTSTFLIRKVLKGETINSPDYSSSDNEDINAADEHVLLHNNNKSDSSLESPLELSPLQKQIQELTEAEHDIFTELTEQYEYDRVLALESIKRTDDCDIFNAMEWCDNHSSDDEFLKSLNEKWKIETTSGSQLKRDSQDTVSLQSDQLFEISTGSEFAQIGSFFFPFAHIRRDVQHEQNFNSNFNTSSCSFESLGRFLQRFADVSKSDASQIRQFPDYCKLGTSNLIVVPAEYVFLAVLQIYSEDREKPLPSFSEVLLCSPTTTLEEVAVFLMRAIHDPSGSRIYCLVHAEKLKYLTAEKAMDLINFLSQGKLEYRLIVICSSEGEGKSMVVSRLHSYQRQMPEIKLETIKTYVHYHICNTNFSKMKSLFASVVDADKSRVRVVLSKNPGVGKSLYIRRKKEILVKYLKQSKLISLTKMVQSIATVPLHGPVVTPDEVLSMLLPRQDHLQSSIIHLDIPQTVVRSIDDILFSLIILQGLCNSIGHVWRCLSTQYYLIEIVIPSEQHFLRQYCETERVLSLLDLLPTTECIGPGEHEKYPNQISIDHVEICTPMYQRVYQYLNKIDNNEQLENFKYAGTMQGDEKSCLKTIIRYCGVKNPSWKEIRHFVWFLNVQLSACEQSNLLHKFNGLKSFVVKFMLEMSRDFATSSITEEKKDLGIIEIRKLWEESVHPYIFFNKNRTSVTHVGFHISKTITGDAVLKADSTGLPIPQLELSKEVLWFLENEADVPCNKLQLQNSSTLIERLAKFMNIKDKVILSPDTNYVLTQDNLTKIMGIQMRFRCRIPVVLMGETGCGKTHLIRFMCQFAAYGHKNIRNMFILKIHGGTTEQDVLNCIKEAEEAALSNRKLGIETVVFFDEANTSDVISLIKEIMCDGRYRGRSLPPFLKFVAACNPYREHDKKMKDKLRNAGLGWCESDGKAVFEKLGEIPMRDLVYRVLDLPSSMKALVYDFGRLSAATEREYIHQIVRNRIHQEIKSPVVIQDISKLLTDCQNFMRESKDECSFVSLRDVERAAIVFNYFYCDFTRFLKVEHHYPIDDLNASIILTISVCYHSRIEKVEGRRNFEQHIVTKFRKYESLAKIKDKDFKEVIKKYQLKLLDSMQLQNNIARNSALRENVFMMAICIELRIPLFLVGKPGSSKSLAKSIVSDSMHGAESAKSVLKKFKKVQLHSHQCSPLSTPASIIEVFQNAKTYQNRHDTTVFASVVVLDEVGLAEASPHLPLKALHPLLEDGTEGCGSGDERCERRKRVAFVGISNWALDPAKMNRGIMVTRGDPEIEELKESARGICHGNKQINLAYKQLEGLFPILSTAYHQISTKQKRQFFGLRDFYSLIKMLYWMNNTSNTILTKAQLLHAIKRNFDGYDDKELDPVKIFEDLLLSYPEFNFSSESGDLKCIKSSNNKYMSVTIDDQLIFVEEPSIQAQFVCIYERSSSKKLFQSLMKPHLFIDYCRETNELMLRKDNHEGLECLSPQESGGYVSLKSKQGKLYLNGIDEFTFVNPEDLVTNPDCTPLGLIQASLLTREDTWHGESRYLLFLTENYSALQTLKQYIVTTIEPLQKLQSAEIQSFEPFVLFGSSFPKDSEYTQVCRNISEVRLCMETGRLVILLNLENLYESLYDVLNQYYMESGGHRYVDLGLRTNRMKCRVHKQFKLILIAEKNKVYQEFPVPLVNRMEKHFVSTKTILKEWQQKLCGTIEKWVKQFTHCYAERSYFREYDVFIGYNSDTVASVVLQATLKVNQLLDVPCKKESEEWILLVFEISICLLLQLATPDGVCRYLASNPDDQDKVKAIYFCKQEHSSLSLLFHRLGEERNGQLIQVTTHSPTLSQEELTTLVNQLNCNDECVIRLHLEAFHTEQDFIDSVQIALEKGLHSDHLLVLECDSGHKNGNLISCCRYRIVDLLNSYQLDSSMTCILFLIHIPRSYPKSSFVSFQEHPWKCYHVDQLISSLKSVTITDFVLSDYSIAEVFLTANFKPFDHDTVNSLAYRGFHEAIYYDSIFPNLLPHLQKDLNLSKQLHNFIPEALSTSTLKKDRIQVLQKIIPENPTTIDDLNKDIVCLMSKALNSEGDSQENWILDEASNVQNLQEAGSFRNALMQKLKQIILPLFSNVLTFIDCYNNLEILDHGDKCQIEAWKAIFKSGELCSRYITAPASVELHKSLNMNCEFPFSWVVYDFVSRQIKRPIQGFSEILAHISVDTKDILAPLSVELVACYLNDFIKLVHITNRNMSYNEIIRSVLLNMLDDAKLNTPTESLLENIALLHFLYEKYKQYFDWFDQLVSHVPSILVKLENVMGLNIKDVTLMAVHETLTSTYFDLKEPFSKGKTALKGWIQKLCQMQSTIEVVLKESTSKETRLNWKWICLKRMFVEHIVLKNEEEMLFIAKRIEKISEKRDQLKSSKTLQILATFLTSVEEGLKKGKVNNPLTKNAIHESCWNLFIEAISLFCFGEETIVSSPEIISELVDTVFPTSDDEDNSKLARFVTFHLEKRPSLQFWLIKSICSFKEHHPEVHLQRMFDWFNESSDCDARIRRKSALLFSTLYLYSVVERKYQGISKRVILEGVSKFEEHRAQPSSPSCLMAISQIQYSCQLLTDSLHGSLPELHEGDLTFFVYEITKVEVNDDESYTGPFWYFLRLILKKHGISMLTEVLKKTEFEWIKIHEIFDNEMEVCQYLDQAAIYNPVYDDFRSAISNLLNSGSSSVLTSKPFRSDQTIPLFLAIYERIHQSHVSMLPSKQIKNTDVIRSFVHDCKQFKSCPKVTQIAEEIVCNKHCHQLPQMLFHKTETHDDSIIRTVVVHSVVTLLADQTNKLTKVFVDILLQPNVLRSSSIPTMHLIGNSTISKSFLRCKNSHNHTRIMANQLCPLCGSTVVEQKSEENCDERSITVQKGYYTEKPGIGFLPPLSYAIIRCILHSCLLWTSCHNEDLALLMHKPVENLQEYFWSQIKEDILLIHQATGRSIDESAMIIHLVIRKITESGQGIIITHNAHKQVPVEKILSIKDQKDWEFQFQESFITPVIEDIDLTMKQVFANLTPKDHSKLFGALYLYEKIPTSGNDTFLWQYHPKITMEHFYLNNIDLKLEEEHPALFLMLTKADSLEATKHISEIVHLQGLVHDIAVQNFTTKAKDTLEAMAYAEFKCQYFNESEQFMLEKTFRALCEAWKLARSGIFSENCLGLDEKYKENDLNENTQMSFLIPTMHGEGLLTCALVDHLVRLHNHVIGKSRDFVEMTLERDWLLHTRQVHITNIEATDFINCKTRVFPLVLKHGSYDFNSGNAVIKYDLHGLEKDLVYQCVLDKREIIGLIDIPQVVWGIKNITLLSTLVKQKIPQKALSPLAKADILLELKTVAQVSETIKVTETIVKYLQREEEAQLAQRKLRLYAESVKLQLPSIKVGEHCQLGNVISLWMFLCIEKEKLHARNDEIPFYDAQDCYKVELPSGQVSSLEESLKKLPTLEDLIGVIYDFIELYLKHCKPDDILQTTLNLFLNEKKMKPIEHNMEEILPREIEAKHAVHTWRHIVLYQNKLKNE